MTSNSVERGEGGGVRSFWLSTPRATGGITTDAAGVVNGGCPYFVKAFKGRHFNDVIRQSREAYGRDAVIWHEYPAPATAPHHPDPPSLDPTGSHA